MNITLLKRARSMLLNVGCLRIFRQKMFLQLVIWFINLLHQLWSLKIMKS